MKVQRGEVVIVDFPYSDQTDGTSGLMTRFSRSSPAVAIVKLELPRSILLISRSIPSFSVKI